jgi:colanic acid/amylovoran biosynthesis glycosyltransferase
MNMPATVAYLLVHYPGPSYTFFQREIIALESQGIDVFPIAVNRIRKDQLFSDRDISDAKRTFAIKATSPMQALVAAIKFTLQSPKAVVHALKIIAKLGLTNLKGTLWHLFQLVEAMLVVTECEKRNVKHIHAHFGDVPATVAWFAAELGKHRGPKSLQSWSMTIHGWTEFTREEATLLREKVTRATFVVAISDFTNAQLMRIAGPDYDPSRCSVVRCGLDLNDYPFSPRKDVSKTPVVLITARLADEKGHALLLEALALANSTDHPMELVCIGDGPSKEFLVSETNRLGLSHQVHWLGAQSAVRVREELERCDVFCLPSFAEGLPVSLMEAMAVGRPVVATAISGVPELVQDKETGILLPAGRADLLAEALIAITTDDTLRESVVKKGRARVAEMHDLSQNGKQLVELFRKHVPDLD